MELQRVEIDSQVLGWDVWHARGITSDDDVKNLIARICSLRQAYVTVHVAAEHLTTVHTLEGNGFRFLETQIRMSHRLRDPIDISAHPFRFCRVTDPADLPEINAISDASFGESRFALDPAFGPQASQARYRRFIEKSLQAADESLYKLVDNETGRIVAFKTHRRTGEHEAQLYLAAVDPAWRTAGVGPVNSWFEMETMRREGIRRFVTHVSASNYPIMNLEIRGLGFRVESSSHILRIVTG